MSLCGDIAGCHEQKDVSIGWRGYRTIRETAIRNGPGRDFEARGLVADGKRLGWQSVRNPSESDTPAPRGTVNDGRGYFWAWVYVIDGGLTGWINAGDIGMYDNGTAWARGPAGVDFHIGYDSCPVGTGSGCGGTVLGRENRTIGSREVYLRYAAQSTAFQFLLAGDVVKQMYRSPLSYRCVEVVQSRSCPVGARGWILESSLV